MAHDLSIYFLPAGKGQSILIKLPPNSWVVLDADLIPRVGKPSRDKPAHRLPALEVLQDASEQEDFRVLAVIVSHFHLDHFRGIRPVLKYLSERGQLSKLKVVLPGDHTRLLDAVEKHAKGTRFASLRSFMRALEELLQPRQLGSLKALDFAWKTHRGAGLRDGEGWVFCFHPDAEDITASFFEWLIKSPPDRRRTSATEGFFNTRANQFAYLLGVGLGRGESAFHALLTADIPGNVLADLTYRLGREHLVDLREGAVGAARCLDELVVQDADGQDRLVPVSAISVPHHGSGVNPAQAEDLRWWLVRKEATSPPDERPTAVIQGTSRAIKERAIDEFHKAGCRVFSSSYPDDLQTEDWEPPQLRERLLGSPGAALSRGGGTLTPPSADSMRYLAVHRDSEGVLTIENKGFFEFTRAMGA